jgi:phosphoribosyl-ATP pyrophosphohydrolase/phosphoribosyl-AMP cyclohydrolase
MTRKPNFPSPDTLLPVIVQDARTKTVLMLGYMNQHAWDKTLAENKVTFYSRSKQRLWTKGETSGHFLTVASYRVDCDADTILIKAIPAGPVCHTGTDTCFEEDNNTWNLHALEQLILERKANPKQGSYTNTLFSKGINKIAQKVGEEAVELIIEAKDENQELFLNEAADLFYHTLVLLAAKGCSLADVERVLEQRHQ